MKEANVPLYLTVILFIYFFPIYTRSVHRPTDPTIPQIKVRFSGEKKHYIIKNSHLEPYPIFKIDPQENNKYVLPDKDVVYRNNVHMAVEGKILKNQIEHLILEINQKKKKYKDFTVIQDKNFNLNHGCGLLVLKFKQYPFVLKYFAETPETFINPYIKGLEPIWFFYMSGGANRHIAGLTRIKNLHYINQLITQHPYWNNKIVTPRKWYWMPNQSKWIKLTGKNLGNEKKITTKLPSVFCIIADEIIQDNYVTISKKNKKKMLLKFCNDVNLAIDPHVDNFFFQYDHHLHRPMMAIVDTEHFPTMVGIRGNQKFLSHGSWYLYLSKKALGDIYFRTKDKRRAAQNKSYPQWLIE